MSNQVHRTVGFRLIPEVGKTLHSSNFINTYLLYTCYLFKPKLFHNCNWGISILLKSKTNNGNPPRREKTSEMKIYQAVASLEKPLGPFLWMGFKCLSATKPQRGNFTNRTLQIPGTYFINLRKMKG